MRVGTRLQVIATIEQWLDGPDKEPGVCWLNGPAGYGKSALSQTIAERYAAEGRLLGSFFFLRGAGERSHISRLIPTLAHQISHSIPATKPLLENHQFQRLIIGPIHSTTSGSFSAFQIFSRLAGRWILIIDALESIHPEMAFPSDCSSPVEWRSIFGRSLMILGKF